MWLASALAACSRNGAPPPDIASCPTLDVGGWTWVGVVAPAGTVSPGERVELRDRGTMLEHGWSYASAAGSFGVRGAFHRTPDSRVELVTESGRRFSVRAQATAGLIDYDPDTYPVLEEPPGTMTFHGRLASTPFSTPITRAWAINWDTGWVQPVAPTPSLDLEVEGAQVPGGVGHCMAIFTEHSDGRTGGCWWPQGGGCLCAPCSREAVEEGLCLPPPPPPPGPGLPCGCHSPPPPPGADAGGRAPLDVEERHDPPPPRRPDGPPPPERSSGPSAPARPSPPSSPSPDASWRHLDAGPVEPPS